MRARLRGESMELEWAGRRASVFVMAGPGGGNHGAAVREVSVGREMFRTQVRAGSRSATAKAGPGSDSAVRLLAPMPGRVIAVKVAAGDAVKRGDLLLTLEAMKMQNEFVAPCDGRVSEVRVKPTAVVGAGDVLAVIAPAR